MAGAVARYLNFVRSRADPVLGPLTDPEQWLGWGKRTRESSHRGDGAAKATDEGDARENGFTSRPMQSRAAAPLLNENLSTMKEASAHTLTSGGSFAVM